MSMAAAISAPALVKPRETYSPHSISEYVSEQGRILLHVFEALERAGIRCCVLHGNEEFSGHIESDVDCIIDSGASARVLLALFHRDRDLIGAEVVRYLGSYFVFASRRADGSHTFVALDFATECDANDFALYDGSEILASRRRYGQFYIPAPNLEFGAYLARCIAKQGLSVDRTRRLSSLFGNDPARCAAQVARYWNDANGECIVAAAQSGNWDLVRESLPNLHSELRWNTIKRNPTRFVANKFRYVRGCIKRLLRPDGVSVVFLGPDGAGKSSTIEAIGPKLADIFPRSGCRGFAPGLLAFLRRGKGSTSEPHGRPARSLPASLSRLVYWFAYHTFSFLPLRLALARSTLVLYDRHFVDILVDQKRYRYGGPIWMLQLLWRIIPKPDLVILLDAPPEILQARKQEVPLEITARQRQAYLTLVQNLPNGRIVDASQPLARVIDQTCEVIMRYAAERTRGTPRTSSNR